MFNKKGVLICLIIFYVLSLVLIAVSIVDAFVIQIYFSDEGSGFLLLGIVLFLTAFVMTITYLRLRKQERVTRKLKTANYSDTNNETPEFDDEEFNQWLAKFEPFARFGAKLEKITDKTFSKFGGLPSVPTEFTWPLFDSRPIPFLLQVDFSEINGDGKLNDFPTAGLLYLFVDSEEVNDPNIKDGVAEYLQGRTFQFVFFDKTDKLITPSKPQKLNMVYKEFNVCADVVKTYPSIEDSDDVYDIYCDRPAGGMDDAYDELCGENLDVSLVGGCATYVQDGAFIAEQARDGEEWVLLMQVASETDDENFMWGDCGMLYFYIRKDDLLARNFTNVELEMQCY